MGLKLNGITDEIVAENLGHAQSLLSRLLAKPVSDSSSLAERKRNAYALGDTYLELGLMKYQQGYAGEDVKADLKRAASHLLQEHEYPPDEGPATPWSFEKVLTLVGCFGEAADQRRAGGISESYYRHPAHQAFVAYLDILKKCIGSGTIPTAGLSEVERECRSEKASKDERTLLLPRLLALSALGNRERAAWDQALSELVATHAKEAKRGELKHSRDGFICLPGLLFAKLGRELGWKWSGQSPYLPESLLGPVI